MLRIENAIQLTRGDLLTPIDVNYFEQVQSNAKKVKRGDLFLAVSANDIKTAIENGAHGIMYDIDIDIESYKSEIAWIKVRNIRLATFELIKYNMLKYKCEYIVCESLIYEIARTLIKDEGVIFVDPQNPYDLLSKMQTSTPRAIISFDEKLLQHLSSDEQKLFHTPRQHGFTIRKSSLITCEILWGTVWQIPYPEILLKYLKGAIELAKDLNILVAPMNLQPLACFEPVYVTKGIYQADSAAQSSQVIIFSNTASNTLLRDIAEFVNTQISWTEKLYLFPIARLECEPNNIVVTNYGSKEELTNLLEDGTFVYALVADMNKNDILLQKKVVQLSLFD